VTSRRAAWALAVLVAAGCGGGRSTPREALESLRAALATHDGAALNAMTDSESVAHRRAEVRERRAMLERGDDPSAVMQGMPMTADEMRRGTEMDAAGILLDRRSPLFADAKWIGEATVVEEAQDGPDATRLRLRGVDGAERDLWFHREDGRWRYDQFRHRVWR
jgi:hypothetical protein